MQETISVIIPVYNVKPYIDRCLQSVCSQTYRDLDIILVDDGSTDGSGEICDAYAKKDERIRVIHKENGGSSSARNAGLRAATGTYIGFLDADDWAEESLYETLYQAIKESSAGENSEVKIVQMMSDEYAEDGRLDKKARREDEKTVSLTAEEYFRELLMHIGDSSFCTKLIKADWMRKFSFSEGRLNEDFELLLAMLPELGSIGTVGKVGYHIRLRGGSNTRGRYNQKLYEDMMENAVTAYRLMEEKFPDCEVLAKRFYLVQALDFLLHIPVEKMTKDNVFYIEIRNRIKSAKKEIKNNPYLDKKQRRNLTVLSKCPKLARAVHKILMKMRESRT